MPTFQSDGANGPRLPASNEPTIFANGGLDKNMSSTLEQIPDVLRESTIAEEHRTDVESKFGATYKNENNRDFIDRTNDDVGVILTFAGLFSAVNSTFIIGMQPNLGDTMNFIMIKAAGGSDAVNLGTLSSSMTHPSSIVWMQALACASFAFSVLAAIGAVASKQWLNSYKAARGRGSLKECGTTKRRKPDGHEYRRLKTVLKSLLILLQISLSLFSLSLSALMWIIQQITISTLITCTTSFGILFYVSTIFESVLQSDSPEFHQRGQR